MQQFRGSSMKLICEVQEDIQCLTEEKDGKKHMYIEGVYMQSDLANKNKRFYPSKVMDKEVGRYIKEVVAKNSAVGELSHPKSANINLERVSHKIESLKIEGKNVMGKAKILETPMGKIARGLAEDGVRLGVSSRGLGTLKPLKEGLMEVGADFKLVTVDIVHDPSAPDAWVNAVMENVEWVWDETSGNWKQLELAEEAKKIIKKLSPRQLEENKKRLFENYLSYLMSQ